MRRKRTVDSNRCPIIHKGFHLVTTRRNHRFDSNYHTLFQSRSFARFTVIRNLRFFMQVLSKSMPYKISYYTKPCAFNNALNCVRYIGKVIPFLTKFQSCKESVFCSIYKPSGFVRYFPYSISSCRITYITFVSSTCIYTYYIAFF